MMDYFLYSRNIHTVLRKQERKISVLNAKVPADQSQKQNEEDASKPIRSLTD